MGAGVVTATVTTRVTVMIDIYMRPIGPTESMTGADKRTEGLGLSNRWEHCRPQASTSTQGSERQTCTSKPLNKLRASQRVLLVSRFYRLQPPPSAIPFNKQNSLPLSSLFSLFVLAGRLAGLQQLARALSLSLSLDAGGSRPSCVHRCPMAGSLISKGSQVPFAGHSDTTRVMRLEVPQRTARRRPLLARGHARPPRQILLSLPSCRSFGEVLRPWKGWRVQPHALHCV